MKTADEVEDFFFGIRTESFESFELRPWNVFAAGGSSLYVDQMS